MYRSASILFLIVSFRIGGDAVAQATPSSGSPQGTVGGAKFWVYFRDKGPASNAERQAAILETGRKYNARAVERRRLRGAMALRGGNLFSERDLPVASTYLAEIERAGARLVHQSRWLNAVSVYATPDQLATIRQLPSVTRVEPVRGARRIEPAPGDAAARAGADPFYGSAFDQLEIINLPALHNRGFTGAGIVIGVLDTGFLRTHAAYNDPQHPINVVAEWDFINDDPDTAFEDGDPAIQHNHGTWVLGVIGAYKVGEFVGGAYDASFILCKTEDVTQEVPIEEDNYVAGLEFIEANGGDIATSSLGYPDFYEYADMDGQTAVTTQAVNVATDLGIICLTAAGNGGQDPEASLIPPGDAFDVITVGAVDYSGILAGFSSNGPTADGRLKPEALALGQGAVSVAANDPSTYQFGLNGTSLSTPLAAAAVACILQAHPDWTISQIRQNLFETAGDYVLNYEPDPASERGYGIIDADAAAQDCNDNDLADLIDIQNGMFDFNDNGIPDACEPPGPIPAVSHWGLVVLALTLLAGATVRIGRRARPA